MFVTNSQERFGECCLRSLHRTCPSNVSLNGILFVSFKLLILVDLTVPKPNESVVCRRLFHFLVVHSTIFCFKAKLMPL